MMRTFLVFTIAILFSCHLNAQYNTNQNKNWVFGNSAGLSFTTGSPVAFTSAIAAPEGCASVSDEAGNLLFYTDGKKVWNRNGLVMPNGVSIVTFNTASTTQGAAIVPFIGDPKKYYIFSLEQAGSAGTLAYSVVDMRLDGGLGDVSAPGVNIYTGLTEKMAVAPTDCGAWVITHKHADARFEVFKITNAGVNATPFESLQGIYGSLDSGVMKVDPTYRRIVLQSYSTGGAGGIEVLSFNSGSGSVFSSQGLSPFNGAYGAEFSADGNVLYTISHNGTGGSKLIQWNISSGTPTSYTVATSTASSIRDLKLAPDGKIYFPSFNGSDSLDRISNPGVIGVGCGYAASAVSLGPNLCTVGLPNTYVFAGLTPIAGASKVCVGGTVTLSDATTGGTWSSSNTAIATVATNGAVSGVALGTVTITYSTSASCYTVWTMDVVSSLLTAITGQLNICVGNTTTLANTTPGGVWFSSNSTVASIGSLTGAITGLTVGSTTISYSFGGGCLVSSLVNVGIAGTVAPVTAGSDTLCVGASVTFTNATTDGVWSSGDPTVAKIDAGTGVVTPLSPGTVTLSYTKGADPCAATATRLVTVNLVPDAGFITGRDTICNGAIITLAGTITGGQWITDDSSKIGILPVVVRIIAVITAHNTGSLTVTYRTQDNTTKCYGRATHTMHILPEAPFTATLVTTPVTCYGGKDGSAYPLITGGNYGPFAFHWSNLATTPLVQNLSAGPIMFRMDDTGMGCFITIADSIVQPDSIALKLAVTNAKCAGKNGKITLGVSGGIPPYKYEWLPASTQQDLVDIAPGFYSVTVTDDSGCTNGRRVELRDGGCGELAVHDVITPNDDGVNDLWVITGIQYYPTSIVKVFDKWGDIVFDQSSYQNDWGGIGKLGAPLPDGTYYYLVDLNAPNTTGGATTFTGTLFIKR